MFGAMVNGPCSLECAHALVGTCIFLSGCCCNLIDSSRLRAVTGQFSLPESRFAPQH